MESVFQKVIDVKEMMNIPQEDSHGTILWTKVNNLTDKFPSYDVSVKVIGIEGDIPSHFLWRMSNELKKVHNLVIQNCKMIDDEELERISCNSLKTIYSVGGIWLDKHK